VDEYDDIDELGSGDDDKEDGEKELNLVLLNGSSDAGTKLLKFFLGAAILDGNGQFQISRKALSEFVEMCGKHKTFELWADPDFNDDGIELTIRWHD
jgi:hypothetical protein